MKILGFVLLLFNISVQAQYNGGSGGGSAVDEAPNASLPVTWLSFTGKMAAGQVILDWSTASEQNNRHFEIERSAENQRFTKIGQVAGAGNSNTVRKYSYTDAEPLTGNSFYRILQVDLDGTKSYSAVVRIDNKNQLSAVNIRPNPIVENLEISIPIQYRGKLAGVITDMNGRTIEQISLKAGLNSFSATSLKPGVYMLTIQQDGKLISRERIVKK